MLLPLFLECQNEPPRDKTNNVPVCQTKTQISLGIRPVCSESLLCTQGVAKGPSFLHADSEDWSDWADAVADLSLCWMYTHFVGFVMIRLKCHFVRKVTFPSCWSFTIVLHVLQNTGILAYHEIAEKGPKKVGKNTEK